MKTRDTSRQQIEVVMNIKRKPYMLTNQASTAFWLLDNLWMPLATSHHTQDKFSLMGQVCGTGNIPLHSPVHRTQFHH